ncbi:hypothetical protein [Porphyromonas levii]|uniref:hypothetical protein n=1 Tax=Porphyromonas levii TaxID=28114 RepID=UPI0020121E44|nr:hypothetical protein [Porphyromonas levii]
MDDLDIIRTQGDIEEWEETANGVTIRFKTLEKMVKYTIIRLFLALLLLFSFASCNLAHKAKKEASVNSYFSTATNETLITYNIEGISSEGAEAKVNYVNGKISKSITTIYGETGQATIIYLFETEKIKVLESRYSYRCMIEDVESDNDLLLDYRISYFINYNGELVGAGIPNHIDIFQEFQRVVPFKL